MTIFGGTYLTYDAKGQREQLAEAIYDISPEDTPLVSMVGKGEASGVIEEWQTDELASVDTANAHIEGDDITTIAALTPTVRIGNRMQISRKLLAISGTTQEVDSAGNANSMARHVGRKGVELKRDIEAIMFANQGSVAGTSTVARKTATLLAYIKTNVNKAAAGTNPTYTDGIPTGATGRGDSTQRAFTETILKALILAAWTEGATIDGKFLFVGPVNKQKVSGFAGIATKTYNISGERPGQSTIVAAADVYVSDFGTISVVPSRWQRERDAFLIDPDFITILHLRPFMVKDLATTGDADKKMLLQEWGVKVHAENALSLAADLTTT